MARLHGAFTGGGSRVGMATDISSRRFGKGHGELASRSGFRRTERGGSPHAAVRRRVSVVPDSSRTGSRRAWQNRQVVRNEYGYRGTEASRERALPHPLLPSPAHTYPPA